MKKIYIITILLILFILSLFIDQQFALLMHQLRNYYLDPIFMFITNIAHGAITFVFVMSLFLLNIKKRKLTLFALSSLLLTGLITALLKYFIKRPRPFETLTFIHQPNMFATWDTSFPSWHAASVFTVLPIISQEYPRLKWYWLIFSILVVFSRLYFNVHYLSDVLFGILLGYIIGLLFLKLTNKYIKKKIH